MKKLSTEEDRQLAMQARANLKARGLLDEAVRVCKGYKVTMVNLLGFSKLKHSLLARRMLYTILLNKYRLSFKEVMLIMCRKSVWGIVPPDKKKGRKRLDL